MCGLVYYLTIHTSGQLDSQPEGMEANFVHQSHQPCDLNNPMWPPSARKCVGQTKLVSSPDLACRLPVCYLCTCKFYQFSKNLVNTCCVLGTGPDPRDMKVTGSHPSPSSNLLCCNEPLSQSQTSAKTKLNAVGTKRPRTPAMR